MARSIHTEVHQDAARRTLRVPEGRKAVGSSPPSSLGSSSNAILKDLSIEFLQILANQPLTRLLG